MFVKNKEVSSVLWNTVHFSDGSIREITEHQHYIITEEPTDDTKYRELIVEHVLPLFKKSMKLEWEEEIRKSLIEIIEQHDLTNTEVWALLDRLKQSRVASYNELFKERMGEDYEAFIKDSEVYEKVSKMVWDSLNNAIMSITGKLFGTYDASITEDTYIGNIKSSDVVKASELLKKLMQS